MLELLVKPTTLDNDIAVIKILQLMGQLTPDDIEYVIKVARQVHDAINLGHDGRKQPKTLKDYIEQKENKDAELPEVQGQTKDNADPNGNSTP